jgi:hypothetical protein
MIFTADEAIAAIGMAKTRRKDTLQMAEIKLKPVIFLWNFPAER